MIRAMRTIDAINEAVGQAMAWLMVPMVLIAFAVVVMRYVLGVGYVWMQESYIWMHSTIFMLAAGYNLLHEVHVRIDLFRHRMSERAQAIVDIVGSLFFLMPTLAIVYVYSYTPILISWRIYEKSPAPGGLPGVFLHKSVVIMFCLLLGLQGLSLIIRSIQILRGRQHVPPGEAPQFGRE